MTRSWIMTEGMAGTENQCLGVAEALGITPEIKRIQLRQPWKILTPYLCFEQSWSFLPELRGPWPDFLITSGRKAIAAARYIKKKNPHTYVLHIQDPRISNGPFDLVAVPYHDKLRGKNVLVTDGAPNRITHARLEQALHPSPSTKQSVGVLIGGNSKTHSLTDEIMGKLCVQLKQLATDYKLLITVSRRTSSDQAHMLKMALQGTDAFIWDGTGDNPYFGILAQADYLIVTSDSTSMMSDAATSGKPLYLIGLHGTSPKFERLYAHFLKLGAARPFQGVLENWTYTPFNDAAKIADSVRKASGLF